MVKLEKILIGTLVVGLTLGAVSLAKLLNNPEDSLLYTNLAAGGFALSIVSTYFSQLIYKPKNRENQEAVQNNSERYAS